MKNLVIHTWNEKGRVFVRYETPNGETKTSNYKIDWYFLIKKSDEIKSKEILIQIDSFIEFKNDPIFPNFTKIYCNDIKIGDKTISKYDIVLKLENNKIETFEGDLMNDKRWYIDHNIEISEKYKKIYFDIETDDTKEKIEIGGERVLSYAAIDSDGGVFFESLKTFTDKSEKELLMSFLKLINNYDILLGWNTKGFDIPYLKTRMKKYELHKTDNYVWRKCANFDLLKRFRHIFRFDNHIKSFSLESISQHFLGRGKIKHSEKIIDLWKNDKMRLKEYNIEDCILVKDLDEKLGVSSMMVRQSKWCGVPVSQFGLYSIIDTYILKTAHHVKQFGKTSIPAINERKSNNTRGNENPNDTSKNEANYTGAIVLEPKIGKYDKVYTFDFKGLYPSMMRTSNIGYDSIHYEKKEGDIINPGTFELIRKSGIIKPTFFNKKLSVINLAITDLITKRNDYKKLKLKMIEEGLNKGPEWERVVSDEIIVKELANSTYGIMGLKYGRYFSVDIAESITLFGQWCINFAKKYFESRNYNVIYGDTDSIFISTSESGLNIQLELDEFHSQLKKELKDKYNIDDCYVELAFDKQYKSFLLVNKKTYAGHVVNIEGKKANEIYTRGLEYIKKNTFSFAADKQKSLVEEILYRNIQKQEIKKFIDEIYDEFYKKEFNPKELSIIQRVGVSLDEYKKTPPLHARLLIQDKEKTGQGSVHSEVEYIITNSAKGGIINGVLLKDYIGDFDRDYYWENKTRPVIERITESIYPNEDFFQKNLTLF